jgi:hypothetical protein
LIRRLGVKVVTITILILKVSAKGAEFLPIGTAYHQSGEILLPDGADGKSTFVICGSGGIGNEALVVKVDDFVLKEDRDDADSAETTVGLDSFHERKEFPVISVVVYAIALIVCVEAFVWCHRCHNTLNLGIVGAAEALNELQEGKGILRGANGGEGLFSIEVVAKGGGTLLYDNNVGLGELLFVVVLLFRSLRVFLFPKVEIDFWNREPLGGVGRVRCTLWGGWDGDRDGSHVSNCLRDIVAEGELKVVCNIFERFVEKGRIVLASVVEDVVCDILDFTTKFSPVGSCRIIVVLVMTIAVESTPMATTISPPGGGIVGIRRGVFGVWFDVHCVSEFGEGRRDPPV